MHFSIGYSEPGAGTDLAALTTSAVKNGDHYLVNGTKVFTSGAEGADYIFLAARTDPDAPDACVHGLSESEERAAEREMLLFRDQLDIMVNLTSRYDNWYFSYGDPFNPGDVPPDW